MISSVRTPATARLGTWGLGAATALLLPMLSGCISWSYERIELGAGPKNYDTALPAQNKRATDHGVCFMGTERGRTEAILVQFGGDRRVYGKWQATHVDRNTWGLVEKGYRLRGEFDPEAAGVREAGPFDALRAVFSELELEHEDQLVRGAHGLIAFGLIRFMNEFPHIDNPPDMPADWPGAWAADLGDDATLLIERTPDDRYRFVYVIGDEPRD